MGAGLAAILVALIGCGGESPATNDSGTPPVDSGSTEDSGVPEDAGIDASAPDAGLDGGPGAASVAWITVPEPVTADHDIALDYAYQYELAIEGDPLVYSLTLERCSQMAGMAETCENESRSNLPGTSLVRWGVDPSQYAVGENHYRFHLILERGAELVDEDTAELVLTATACETCVGSPGAP